MSLYPERSPLDELTAARMEARNASDVLAVTRKNGRWYVMSGMMTQAACDKVLRGYEQRVLDAYTALHRAQAYAAEYLRELTAEPSTSVWVTPRSFHVIREKMEADRLKRKV